jgi:hypothetical protein
MDVIKVVTGGLAIITNRMVGAGIEPTYIHWGTGGATTATTSDSALTTPRSEARVSGTSSRATTTYTNDTWRCVGTLTCASTSAAISEVGLFDANTSGNMFLRGTFSDINLNVGDSIQFTVSVAFVTS